MRLLGIDLGRRRIGVAVSDEAGVAARPLTTLARSRTPAQDAAVLARLAAEQRAGELIVGLPLALDGRLGPQAEETVRWAEKVAVLSGMPVSLRDERRTTQLAETHLGAPRRGRAGGPPTVSQRRARNARLDREAAVLILQSELDARRSTAR